MTHRAEIRLAAGLPCDCRIARRGQSMRLMLPPPTSLAMQQGRAEEVRRPVWHPRWRRWPKTAWSSHIDVRLNPTCHERASKTARMRRAGTAAQPDRALRNVASKAVSGRAKPRLTRPTCAYRVPLKLVRRRMMWNKRPTLGAGGSGSSGSGQAGWR